MKKLTLFLTAIFLFQISFSFAQNNVYIFDSPAKLRQS